MYFLLLSQEETKEFEKENFAVFEDILLMGQVSLKCFSISASVSQ